MTPRDWAGLGTVLPEPISLAPLGTILVAGFLQRRQRTRERAFLLTVPEPTSP